MEDADGTPTTGRLAARSCLVAVMIADILHYIFDLWADAGDAPGPGNIDARSIRRDIVVGFEKAEDARRFRTELRERLEKFELTLHPEKTRLIEFGRFAARVERRRGLGKPETFNFLGFTHICGRISLAISTQCEERAGIG